MKLENFDIICFGNDFYGIALTNMNPITGEKSMEIRFLELDDEHHSYRMENWIKDVSAELEEEYNWHYVRHVFRPRDTANIHNILSWGHIFDDKFTTEVYDSEY